RRFHDATNTGDAEFISKTIDEIVEPDALIRTPVPIEATGAQALKEVFARLHRIFPDLHITVEDLIAEGDKVVGRNTVTGTHQGEYMAVATESPLSAAGTGAALESSGTRSGRVVGDDLAGRACGGVEGVVPCCHQDVVALELQGACKVDGVVSVQGVLGGEVTRVAGERFVDGNRAKLGVQVLE